MAKILISLDNQVLSWMEWGMAMPFKISSDTKVVNDPITLAQSVQPELFRRILAAASIKDLQGNPGDGTPLCMILATVR
jgi:hypothetical protein